jgi:predicted Zn-dependent protease
MSAHSYRVGHDAFRHAGRVAEIDDILAAGVARLPDEPSLAIAYAWAAHNRADWPEAAARWAAARDRFPDEREPVLRGAEALEAAGRADEAQALRARLA